MWNFVKTGVEMNLSFAGCGFLGIYHLGVSKTLASNGRRFLDNVHRFGGASAGALVASMLAVNGADTDFIECCREFCISLAHQTRDHMFGVFTPGSNLLMPLALFLDETLPPDAHEKATGRLYISVTDFETRKNEIVSVYRSKEELVEYLLATSCIPLVTASKPVTINGRKFYDGGITNNLPMFNDGSTILVSPFDGRQDICPNDPSSGRYMNVAKQDFRISVDNLVRGLDAFLTPSDKVLNNYFKQGEHDACRYLKKMNLYDSSS